MKKFDDLFDKEKYQVFLYKVRLNFPLNIGVHTWLITNKKGQINRYDVLSYKYKKNEFTGFVHKNVLEAIEWFKIAKYKPKLYSYIEGEKNSSPFKLINFIEDNYHKYPFKEEYSYYPGPNSNTFTNWILKNNKDSGLKLPIDAFGRFYFKLFK